MDQLGRLETGGFTAYKSQDTSRRAGASSITVALIVHSGIPRTGTAMTCDCPSAQLNDGR